MSNIGEVRPAFFMVLFLLFFLNHGRKAASEEVKSPPSSDFKGEETLTPGKIFPEVKNEIPSNLNMTQKISREKALELAAQFLKNQNAEWGTPVGITEYTKCYNNFTKKERGNTPDKIWDSCYVVTYPTDEAFIQLKGAKGVVVSNDGSKIIFSPLE